MGTGAEKSLLMIPHSTIPGLPMAVPQISQAKINPTINWKSCVINMALMLNIEIMFILQLEFDLASKMAVNDQ